MHEWQKPWTIGNTTHSNRKNVMHEYFVVCGGNNDKWRSVVGEAEGWADVLTKVNEARQRRGSMKPRKPRVSRK
jgi:hypothetical protein